MIIYETNVEFKFNQKDINLWLKGEEGRWREDMASMECLCKQVMIPYFFYPLN